MELKFKNEIFYLKPDQLIVQKDNPNYVPPNLMNDIIDDIKRNGFYGAILINKDNVIVDGAHRFEALVKLGADQIPCTVDPDLDEKMTKVQTIRLNREKGYLVPVETGTNLMNLTKEIPMDILSEVTAIPMNELVVLTNLKYEPDLQEVPADSEPTNWTRIDSLISILVEKIKRSGYRYNKIITVSRGGLVPARLVADRLDIQKIILDDFDNYDEHSLFVDDIYDTGKTFRRVKGSKITFAVLFLRKGVQPPDNLVAGGETEGSEYVVFPWDKFEFRRTNSAK